MQKRKWTQEEKYLIYDLVKEKTISQIAEIFGVTYSCMASKIHKMGLKCKREREVSWSEKEDQILCSIYEKASKDYIMSSLPKRTWCSIRQRAKKVFGMERLARDVTYVDHTFFDEWTEKSAYIFGFILADGYLCKNESGIGNKNVLQIENGIKDIDIVYKIAAALKFRGRIVQSATSAKINIHNANIINQLIEKGIPPKNKTFLADFPKDIPKEFVRHCIRGLIDGDGSSLILDEDSRKRYMIGFCGTEAIVKKVFSLIPFDLSENKVYQEAPHCWRFGIRGKKAYEIGKWLYGDASIYLDRKKEALDIAKELYT